MSRIKIVTRSGKYYAELDGSDISNAIWLSLPFNADINMMVGNIYFEMPIEPNTSGMERTTVLEAGDVAWWPGPRALCIFYGPTVLSKEDGRPVSHHPVIKIGNIKDCKDLEDSGDRQRILITQDY
ncbi:MAG TPA: cyclophilin-like fold protein [Candidatus Methanomethylophilaceae archaeon]|nr:cyclophilin-like fold protein [Candidatus Methanomethylophilaceae archaeon]